MYPATAAFKNRGLRPPTARRRYGVPSPSFVAEAP